MDCAELKTLRQEAAGLFKELAVRRRRAREYAAGNAGESAVISAAVRRGDFEAYLQRCLAKSAAHIEAHIARHGCQV
jgi:hypothetical protein